MVPFVVSLMDVIFMWPVHLRQCRKCLMLPCRITEGFFFFLEGHVLMIKLQQYKSN